MNIPVAILGGLIGGGMMVAVLYMAIWMMPQQMKMNLLLLLGTMLVPVGAAAYAVGFMAHVMMSVVFGVVHGGLIEATGTSSAGAGIVYGVLFGLIHALVVGIALGMMPMVHPRLRSGRTKPLLAFAGGPPASDEELLDAPGYFGMNYPPATVMGFFMLHVMFGAIVGALYGALA